MTLEEAQIKVDEWIKTYGVRYFSELTNMAILAEEVGELAESWLVPTATSLSKNPTKNTIWLMRWLMYCGF